MTEILQKVSQKEKKKRIKQKETKHWKEKFYIYTRNKTWELKNPEAIRKEL